MNGRVIDVNFPQIKKKKKKKRIYLYICICIQRERREEGKKGARPSDAPAVPSRGLLTLLPMLAAEVAAEFFPSTKREPREHPTIVPESRPAAARRPAAGGFAYLFSFYLNVLISSVCVNTEDVR